MSLISEKIKSRGYWQFRLHPATYTSHHVSDYKELEQVVEGSRVQWRGWDFPHLDRTKEITRAASWVGQETDWQHYKELWRLYLSGQFVFLGGYDWDWRDESGLWPPHPKWEAGKLIGIFDILVTFSEFMEFASRLSQTPVGASTLAVSFDLHGLLNRRLYDERPNHDPVVFAAPATADHWSYERVCRRSDLIADAGAIAIHAAQDVYARFGFEVPEETLRDVQDRATHRGVTRA